MVKSILLLIILITSICTGPKAETPQVADSPSMVSNGNEGPMRVSVCEIAKDPAAYNQKLIEVTGFVSHGFEDSSLFDPSCSTRFGIWVEIGGRRATGTVYCCDVPAERTRPENLIVETISIPLTEDERFRLFDKLLQREPDSIVHATMVGRYFSGKKQKFPGGEYWVGYGHFGMSTLFVIQQVTSVDPHDRADMDYGASVDQPDTDFEGCGSYTILRDDDAKSDIEIQTKAENGERTWIFNDPKRVAFEGLAALLKTSVKAPIQLTETRKMPGRIVYHWRPNGKKGVRYMVVVSRLYWLSFYAKDSSKTIWVVSAAYRVCD